jgi:hypothetical protein
MLGLGPQLMELHGLVALNEGSGGAGGYHTPYNAMLCYAMLCYAMLCYAILRY